MEEKLLALLVAKFLGVPEATLKRIASKKAGSVTDEAQLQSIADGIDYGQIVQSEVDNKITDANKKAVQNYEAVHKLKEGKPVTEPEPGKDPDTNKDEAPAWAKAMVDQNKALLDRIASLEVSKTTETRIQALDGKLKDIPESIKTQKLKDFKRMNFESDDAFNEYLQEVDTDIVGLKQELADKGLSGQGKPMFAGKGTDGTSSAVASFIESKKEDKGQLTGKEV